MFPINIDINDLLSKNPEIRRRTQEMAAVALKTIYEANPSWLERNREILRIYFGDAK